MSDSDVKESRRVMRLVQDHLAQAHRGLGAKQESIGLVDILYHPENKLSYLNYVTPRKNTAWIPGPAVEKGLERLRELDRTPRVYYIEGLFPPLFARSLRELGLAIEQEIPLMTYKTEDNHANADYKPLPDGLHVREVNDQDGIALWWYVWRNAHYDVVTHGSEPLYVGETMREIALGRQQDVLLYRHGFPVGVVRVTTQDDHKTAHIAALALMREARSDNMVTLLHRVALKIAIDHGCELVFASGENENDRTLCRNIGFVDSGSVVCYAQAPEATHEDTDGEPLEQPVFILR